MNSKIASLLFLKPISSAILFQSSPYFIARANNSCYLCFSIAEGLFFAYCSSSGVISFCSRSHCDSVIDLTMKSSYFKSLG